MGKQTRERENTETGGETNEEIERQKKAEGVTDSIVFLSASS